MSVHIGQVSSRVTVSGRGLSAEELVRIIAEVLARIQAGQVGTLIEAAVTDRLTNT